ncbi:LOW QUALITY PROTEIN: KIF23-like protein, partial [Mya arenaria]
SSLAFARTGQLKEVQYKFQQVFDEVTSQKTIFDHVALPLVDDLVFKPDRMNGFDVQTEADAMMERQRRDILPALTPKTPGSGRQKKEFEFVRDTGRLADPTCVSDIDEDNTYAVFVSYIEIYNNYDSDKICVSQLSLVDLAGSERTNRTKNQGDRLKEATAQGKPEISGKSPHGAIPRFQADPLNYFDGDGRVRMVICVNPKAEEYDETVHVMKFAEISQEIMVQRSQQVKFDLGFTPGRRRLGEKIREEQLREAEKIKIEQGSNFRGRLVGFERDYEQLQERNEELENQMKRQGSSSTKFESRCRSLEARLADVQAQLDDAHRMRREYEAKDKEKRKIEQQLGAQLEEKEKRFNMMKEVLETDTPTARPRTFKTPAPAPKTRTYTTPVSKLEQKDTKTATKYMLTHQDVGSDGEFQTKYFKREPGTRKRRSSCPQPSDFDGEWTDPEERCAIAIEGHRRKRSRHTPESRVSKDKLVI